MTFRVSKMGQFTNLQTNKLTARAARTSHLAL